MSTEVLDAVWFERIEPFMNGGSLPDGRSVAPVNEIEGSLRASPEKRAAQMAMFVAGETDAPDLRPDLDVLVLAETDKGLRQLEDEVSEHADEIVRRAYLPRIRELQANTAMLLGAASGNTELFEIGNLERFGEPDRDVFDANIAFARDYATRVAETASKGSVAQELAMQFVRSLPGTESSAEPQSQEQFQRVKELLQPTVEEILDAAGPWSTPLTGKEAAPMFQRIIDQFGFGYTVVPQKPGLNGMAVLHAAKEVRIPMGKRYDDPHYLTGLALHEIWVHVNEAIQGAEQSLQLCSRGLSRFLFAGEGKGLMAEQTIYPTYEAFMQTPRALEIARRHLAIGAARGLLTGERLGFRQVYEFVNQFDRVIAAQQAGNDAAQEVVDEHAHIMTTELLTTRTQKGITGLGMASLQDKVYAEGSGPQMRLLAENPQVFPYLNLGKYNLADPNHRAVLEDASIVPRGMVSQ